MSEQNFKNNAMRAALTGAIAWGVSKYGLGYESVPLDVYGMTVDSNIGFGLAAGLGSIVGAEISQYGISKMENDNKKAFTESRIAQPAIVGASTYAFARLMGGVPSALPVIGLGAGSELASAYAQDSYNNMNKEKNESSAQSASAYV